MSHRPTRLHQPQAQLSPWPYSVEQHHYHHHHFYLGIRSFASISQRIRLGSSRCDYQQFAVKIMGQNYVFCPCHDHVGCATYCVTLPLIMCRWDAQIIACRRNEGRPFCTQCLLIFFGPIFFFREIWKSLWSHIFILNYLINISM